MSANSVEISNVSLSYYTPERETLALEQISLNVESGQFVAIVGSSGCGKSTLLSVVAGLVPPTEGTVLVNGKYVQGTSPNIGYMFQKDTLLEWRTVLQNALLGSELLGLDKNKSRERATSLLTSYGLGEFLHALPTQLSGGMRQRAALARTLCTAPEVLLLDEPFSALDFQTKLALSDEISGILRAEGKTVILVTHDIAEAVSIADRVIVMSRRPGRIKSDHRITYPSAGSERPSPFKARSCPEFNGYFQAVWDELDVHKVE